MRRVLCVDRPPRLLTVNVDRERQEQVNDELQVRRTSRRASSFVWVDTAQVSTKSLVMETCPAGDASLHVVLLVHETLVLQNMKEMIKSLETSMKELDALVKEKEKMLNEKNKEKVRRVVETCGFFRLMSQRRKIAVQVLL